MALCNSLENSQGAAQAFHSGCLEYLLSHDTPSPCFVIDEDRLLANLQVLDEVQRETGARVLLALKAYAAWPTFPLLSLNFQGALYGTCASSVDEARLGKEEFGGEVHVFAAAWSQQEMEELLDLADHIVFNSLAQWRMYKPHIMLANAGKRKTSPIQCGLRLNPEHSEGAVAIYNPCDARSRLGIRSSGLARALPQDLEGLNGLHFHTLCEQNSDALARTLDAFEKKFKKYIKNRQWLNFGGGHHITRADYNLPLLKKCLRDWRERYGATIYLEPGEAVALNAGWLAATILDIVEADMPVAILDTSAACHMPDVLEMPYRPEVWYASPSTGIAPLKARDPFSGSWTCRLAGKSCLAGDAIGEYSFSDELVPGQKLVFADMAIYSMVKTTTFNGLRLPDIAIYNSKLPEKFRVIRHFGYDDFKNRLG